MVTGELKNKIVTAMDGIYEQMARLKTVDTRGDVYEYLLSKIATAARTRSGSTI